MIDAASFHILQELRQFARVRYDRGLESPHPFRRARKASCAGQIGQAGANLKLLLMIQEAKQQSRAGGY
jgi:hypothetical protein